MIKSRKVKKQTYQEFLQDQLRFVKKWKKKKEVDVS